MRIENDETKGVASPFIILAHVRTGGTFCAHALSNHPQIFCDRGETFHHNSMWRKHVDMKPGRLCHFLWNQTGYQASGFRLIYRQAFHERVWPVIKDYAPKIIHLQRHSLIRQALSNGYQQWVRAGKGEYFPVHSFQEAMPPKQTLPIKRALYHVCKIQKEHKIAKQRMMRYKGLVLDVWYEDMVDHTGGSASAMEGAVAREICEFLKVRNLLTLPVDLKRDFPVPTPEMFANWDEIEKMLRKEGFGQEVEQELGYWEEKGKD